MKKVKVFTLIGFGMLMAACSTSVNKSTTTHVKDLAQSDVFGVLPEADEEVMIYNTPEEIGGEYLELATVNIQEINAEKNSDSMMEMLKKEAKELGGNGILLIKSSTNEKGRAVTKEVKAIAVYTLEEIPSEEQIVML